MLQEFLAVSARRSSYRWRTRFGTLAAEKPLELTDLFAMISTMLSTHWNWQKLFSYAEVVCFISAWAVGLLVANEGQRPEREPRATRSFAANSDSLGVQAKLVR